MTRRQQAMKSDILAKFFQVGNFVDFLPSSPRSVWFRSGIQPFRKLKLLGEDPTIGLILCKSAKKTVVELTMPKDANIHAKEYSGVPGTTLVSSYSWRQVLQI